MNDHEKVAKVVVRLLRDLDDVKEIRASRRELHEISNAIAALKIEANMEAGRIRAELRKAREELEELRKAGIALKKANDPLCALPLNLLRFSERTASALVGAGVTTVGDLVEKSEFDLLKTANFGRKSLKEVKEFLATVDLSLRAR